MTKKDALLLCLLFGGGVLMLLGIARYTLLLQRTASCVAYPVLQMHSLIVEPIKRWSTGQHKNMCALQQQLQDLNRDNEQLREKNIQLSASLSYMQRTKALRAFSQRYKQQGRVAQVLTRVLSEDSHFFLIDAGSQKGITADMVVVYKNNLIGKVAEVYPWYSKVCLVTDKRCKIAAYCAKTRAKGIHEGRNQAFNTQLCYVDHLAKINQDDLVLSSGEGLIFPEGFALGKIASYTSDGLCKSIVVEPLCDLRDIDYCMVMDKC